MSVLPMLIRDSILDSIWHSQIQGPNEFLKSCQRFNWVLDLRKPEFLESRIKSRNRETTDSRHILEIFSMKFLESRMELLLLLFRLLTQLKRELPNQGLQWSHGYVVETPIPKWWLARNGPWRTYRKGSKVDSLCCVSKFVWVCLSVSVCVSA